MKVAAFRWYVRRGDSYRVIVDSIIPDGNVTWVVYRRPPCCGGSDKRTTIGYSIFVRRFKEAV